MIHTRGVDKAHIVTGKGGGRERHEFNTVVLRVHPYRRMHGTDKAMEEATLDAAVLKKLAHILQGIDGILHSLGGEAVHQVSMYQDARIGKATGDLRHLLDRYALLHELQQTIRGHF